MTSSRTDSGFASLAVLMMAAAFGVLTVVAGGVRWASDFRAVQTAADLAAIAGANARLEGDLDPCAQAADIASANTSHLEECSIFGEEVHVQLSRPSAMVQVRAQAVAGSDLPTG